nr:MAG TPA: hypothetical protein [Caudoviricetes sp.]
MDCQVIIVDLYNIFVYSSFFLNYIVSCKYKVHNFWTRS